MTRQEVTGLLSQLAALLPAPPAEITRDDIDSWTLHLGSFEVDDVAEAVITLAGTWTEDRLPVPLRLTELVRQRIADRTRHDAVTQARARLAAAHANPAIPSMRRSA